MRVAVDAMGGDNAPLEIIRGSLLALERIPDLSIVLVGDEALMAPILEESALAESPKTDRVETRHASEVIEMGESPVEAVRRKKDSSIVRCMEALRHGEVEAVVSAGDTGGVVASATRGVPRLKGVKRYGIAIGLPTTNGHSLVCDVGANIRAKPLHLFQYAIMSTAYAQEILGIENPRVGVLSVGEEEAKGTDLVKKVHHLLSSGDFNFIGNVEGSDIFHGVADVIVCDGFVGNVILKTAEGIAEAFVHQILSLVKTQANGDENVTAFIQRLRDRMDYSTTGGAPLLGVRGSVIICHGRSEAKAIANAIQVATTFTESRVNERIVEAVERFGALSGNTAG